MNRHTGRTMYGSPYGPIVTETTGNACLQSGGNRCGHLPDSRLRARRHKPYREEDIMDDLRTMPEQYWKEKLDPEQYQVCRMKGTERPFTGALWDNHESGMYDCVACGQALFSSDAKFESGSGWPSFDDPVNRQHVE